MKYVKLVEWSASRDALELKMLGEDQQVHAVELGSDCLAVLAAVLSAEAEKRRGDDHQGQLIRPVGMQTAWTDQGDPMVLMVLKGGAELPLVFKPESLRMLIAELNGLQRTAAPDAEVRWR